MGISFKQGINVNGINNNNNNSSLDYNTQQSISNLSNNLITVRVTDIVLNEYHPKFQHVGEWNGIGTIFYQTIGLSSLPLEGFAFPFNPNCKVFPLVNELVTLIKVPSKFTDNNQLQEIYYYFNPVGVWNHPHHNASPQSTSTPLQYKELINSIQNDYNESDLGYVRRIEDEGADINLNFTKYPNNTQPSFNENPSIHPLLPFMGDVIFEGRNGQSIRFGSTSRVSPPFISSTTSSNSWSSAGLNTSPITIIRNGQSSVSNEEGWIPITENIHYDLSSIYLTSTQRLKDFKVREIYDSYDIPPIAPSNWTKPQIAINSDRIVINAKTDNILLSTPKIIGFSANDGVRIDTDSLNVSCNKIKLGSKNANQSVLLGENTVDLLRELTFAVKDLATILQVQRDYPGGVLTTSYNSIAGNAIICLDSIIGLLNDGSLKSQTTKVQ